MGPKEKNQVFNNVAARRIKCGLTQAKLADLVYVSRQTIISLEKGSYSPNIVLALRLADALDTNIERLFYLERQNIEA